MENMLNQLKKREESIKDSIAALKIRDAMFASFLSDKEEKQKTRESLRCQRSSLYATKKAAEDDLVRAKEKIDQLRKNNAEIQEALEKAHQRRADNIKKEAEIILPSLTEHKDILEEKKAAMAILAKMNSSVVTRTFETEKTRLSQLRSKRESIRKDHETKRALLQAREVDAQGTADESKLHLESRESVARRTGSILQEEQKRLDGLKTQLTKRNEALRKLGVFQIGAAVIKESKRAERRFKDKQLP